MSSPVATLPRIVIDETLPTEYRDSGRFRSYQLYAEGRTLEALYESATISEVDQDGGEIRCWGFDDVYCNEAAADAERVIKARFEKESP
jgi:hypothetical protein